MPHCIITGCIARDLLKRPSYVGIPKPGTPEFFEMTLSYARVMAPKLRGRPLRTEHEMIPIGQILSSWIQKNPQTNKDEWWIKAMIDQNSRAGCDIIKAIANDETNPFGEHIAQLSLASQGLNPEEVSVVKKGARAGSDITNLEFLSDEQVEAIKSEQYKPVQSNYEASDPWEGTEPPLVLATWNAMSGASFTAIRKGESHPGYDQTSDAPQQAREILDRANKLSSQMQPSLDQEEAELRQRLQQIQQRKQQTNSSPSSNQQSAQQGGGGQQNNAQQPQQQQQQQQQQQPPVSYADHQFNKLTQRLNGEEQGAQPNAGNHHHIYNNPADDPLLKAASYFDRGTNVLSKPDMEEGKKALLTAAQHKRQMEDQMKAKDAELEASRKHIQELQSKVVHHEKDLSKQKKQVAAIMKRLMERTVPNVSDTEKQDLDSFEEHLTPGAVQALHPLMVKASAYMDRQDSAYSKTAPMDFEEQEEKHADSNSFYAQVQHALGQPAPLVAATGANLLNSNRKRTAAQMNAPPPASGSASNRAWNSVPNQLRGLFEAAEAADTGKMSLQDCRTQTGNNRMRFE